MSYKRGALLFLLVLLVSALSFSLVLANVYLTDIYFTIPNSVYVTNERIEFKGFIYQANYTNNGTLISSSGMLANATVNLTLFNSTGANVSTYNFTTDSTGAFYSRSNYYTSGQLINAPSAAGTYKIKAEYTDPNRTISFSEVNISVVNQSVDLLSLSAHKAIYNPSEAMIVEVEAVRQVGDKFIYVSNVSVNGSVRNSSKSELQDFNCTTSGNGKCSVSLTASSSYGDYFLEIGGFKAFSSFSVVPFSFNVYMKDDFNSLKNVFAIGEQAKVEVKINNASSSDVYNFSGYIADSAGNSVKAVPSTILNLSNSFTNNFLFTVDSLAFGYSTYSVHLTVSKSGDGNMISLASFQVQDWMLGVEKKSAGSGFEYDYSSFPNKTLKFEVLPNWRTNGTVITNITTSFFNVSLRDSLNNIFASADASWNVSCGKSGCYEFSVTSPTTSGQYVLYTTLSYNGDTQTNTRVVNIVNGAMSAQSTDKDGNLKELFGTNEYVYLSLTSYNLTSASFNLSDAEVFLVNYMNGTEYSYTNVSNLGLVNASNSAYEWAWNLTSQRIKMDVPKAGGVYNVFLFGNNRSFGTEARFIVNPYDSCVIPKDSASTSSGSGYYYVWQFRTADTIYFEIQLTQANNPLGRASAVNGTNSSTYGKYSGGCNASTSTKQVVNNATLTIAEVKNVESGALQSYNSSGSSCQSSDASGRYSCTVKPLSKWDGGSSIVKFNVLGQDGTTSSLYGNFEARAFYMYGYSNTWQNAPTSNISLNINLYEAGSGWWGSSGGVGGTVTVKRVEYQGRDGEWIWPPVNSGYNTTNLSSASITSGSGSISLPVSLAPSGVWKTGYYRVVLQATTTSGDTDYGYAWFSVKLWDVYGQPVECTISSCNYKSYFNSKENITLFVSISKAGGNLWSWSYSGNEGIYGNVTVGIKKIEECRSWPCKELNSSDYAANTIVVNSSSLGYQNANSSSVSNYIIQINKTSSGGWNSGWYSVVLNVNGTDTGYAWFNAIPFYVETQPTDINGSNYKSSIRGNQPMYFNISTTKSYKWSYTSGARYNASDYVNTTLQGAVLRTWDSQTYLSKELNYPTNFNITPNSINGSALLNFTYLNGSWPAGWYSGEITLRNSDNSTSTGWLWFNVQPFRVNVMSSGNNYNIDSEQCTNATLDIYDPEWSSSSLLSGNYSITSVYETVWNMNSQSTTYYGNYTINGGANSSSFNATNNNVTICPNSGVWGAGSSGGYHYLNIVAKDNALNDTQSGWLSFRTIPFTISWSGTGGYKLSTANAVFSVTLAKPAGGNTTGNLTSLYQWRYDSGTNGKETYRFTVANASGTYCDSSTAGQCTVNGTANVTVYAPTNGWRVGWNYIQSEWTKNTNSEIAVQDWQGISFDGRSSYNGYFSGVNGSGYWKSEFTPTENMTIRLTVQDSGYSGASGVSVTGVYYASSQNCGSESCLSYTSATYNSPLTTDSNGTASINIAAPSGEWTKGSYAIKATVSGSGGAATVTGGSIRIKDFTAPNVTFSVPQNNATYNTSLSFSASTTESAQCGIELVNYDNFYSWYCGGWNATNGTGVTIPAQTEGACNITKYLYNGSSYRAEYVTKDYHSFYDGTGYSYCNTYSSSSQSCSGQNSSRTTTYLTTGGTSHTYTLNLTELPAQHYGLRMWCYDDDSNYVNARAAFKINNSG